MKNFKVSIYNNKGEVISSFYHSNFINARSCANYWRNAGYETQILELEG